MSYNYRRGQARAPSAANKARIQSIESPDGSRYAYSRARKKSMGDGRFDIVESWVVKARINGKVVVMHSDASEETARGFVDQTHA